MRAILGVPRETQMVASEDHWGGRTLTTPVTTWSGMQADTSLVPWL